MTYEMWAINHKNKSKFYVSKEWNMFIKYIVESDARKQIKANTKVYVNTF